MLSCPATDFAPGWTPFVHASRILSASPAAPPPPPTAQLVVENLGVGYCGGCGMRLSISAFGAPEFGARFHRHRPSSRLLSVFRSPESESNSAICARQVGFLERVEFCGGTALRARRALGGRFGASDKITLCGRCKPRGKGVDCAVAEKILLFAPGCATHMSVVPCAYQLCDNGISETERRNDTQR